MDEAEATSEINKRIRLRQEVTAHMYENVYLLPLHRQVNVFGMNKRVDFPCRADEKVFAWKVKKAK